MPVEANFSRNYIYRFFFKRKLKQGKWRYISSYLFVLILTLVGISITLVSAYYLADQELINLAGTPVEAKSIGFYSDQLEKGVVRHVKYEFTANQSVYFGDAEISDELYNRHPNFITVKYFPWAPATEQYVPISNNDGVVLALVGIVLGLIFVSTPFISIWIDTRVENHVVVTRVHTCICAKSPNGEVVVGRLEKFYSITMIIAIAVLVIVAIMALILDWKDKPWTWLNPGQYAAILIFIVYPLISAPIRYIWKGHSIKCALRMAVINLIY